jgi:hypothetical protein
MTAIRRGRPGDVASARSASAVRWRLPQNTAVTGESSMRAGVSVVQASSAGSPAVDIAEA